MTFTARSQTHDQEIPAAYQPQSPPTLQPAPLADDPPPRERLWSIRASRLIGGAGVPPIHRQPGSTAEMAPVGLMRRAGPRAGQVRGTGTLAGRATGRRPDGGTRNGERGRRDRGGFGTGNGEQGGTGGGGGERVRDRERGTGNGERGTGAGSGAETGGLRGPDRGVPAGSSEREVRRPPQPAYGLSHRPGEARHRGVRGVVPPGQHCGALGEGRPKGEQAAFAAAWGYVDLNHGPRPYQGRALTD